MRMAWLLFATMALAACGKADNAPGPGGVTVGEARALDEAAAMLDKRRPPPEALIPNARRQEDAPQGPEQSPPSESP
ncbi:hypothetical protein B2G71_00590 [Novosphingobium sp. PC22D]|uniref:hypothetical protein n=1 Tax=Novosphingobium sp. PC22D TaxID=1962403 RepID=UPI000BFADB1A|nr:hypothetical protein [Novosphingobium sp. PC22D]PEQ14684.1 hypothetical protein B2G71_00590 [Novosphingobium sp. PC22D]